MKECVIGRDEESTRSRYGNDLIKGRRRTEDMRDKPLKAWLLVGAIVLAVALLPGIAWAWTAGQPDPGDIVVTVTKAEVGGALKGATLKLKTERSTLLSITDGVYVTDPNTGAFVSGDADKTEDGRIVISAAELQKAGAINNDPYVVARVTKTGWIPADVSWSAAPYKIDVPNYGTSSPKHVLKVLVKDELGATDKGKAGIEGVTIQFDNGVGSGWKDPDAQGNGYYYFAVPDNLAYAGMLKASCSSKGYAVTDKNMDAGLGKIKIQSELGQTYIIMERTPDKGKATMDSGNIGPGTNYTIGLCYALRVTVRDAFNNFLPVQGKNIQLGSATANRRIEHRGGKYTDTTGGDDWSDVWYFRVTAPTSATLTVARDGYTARRPGETVDYKVSVDPAGPPTIVELSGMYEPGGPGSSPSVDPYNPRKEAAAGSIYSLERDANGNWFYNSPLRGMLFNLMAEVKNELGKGLSADTVTFSWTKDVGAKAVWGRYAGWATTVTDEMNVTLSRPGYFSQEYKKIKAGDATNGATFIHFVPPNTATENPNPISAPGQKLGFKPLAYRLRVTKVYDELGNQFAISAAPANNDLNVAAVDTTQLWFGHKKKLDTTWGDYDSIVITYSAPGSVVDYWDGTNINPPSGGKEAYIEATGPGTITVSCPGYVTKTMDISTLPSFDARDKEFKDSYALPYAFVVSLVNEAGGALTGTDGVTTDITLVDADGNYKASSYRKNNTNLFYLRGTAGYRVKAVQAGYVTTIRTDTPNVPFAKATSQTSFTVAMPFVVKIGVFDELGKEITDATVKVGGADPTAKFRKDGRHYYGFTVGGALNVYKVGYAWFADPVTITPTAAAETVVTLSGTVPYFGDAGGKKVTATALKYIVKATAVRAEMASVTVPGFKLVISGPVSATIVDGQAGDEDATANGIIYYKLDNSDARSGVVFTASKGATTVSITRDVGKFDSAAATQVDPVFMLVSPDITAPSAPSITEPVAGYVNTPTVTVKGTIDVAADETLPVTVDVYVGTTKVGSASVTTTGTARPWEVANVPLVAGSNVIKAKAIDGAANESGWSTPVTVTLDTTAPAAPTITSPATDTKTKATAVDVSGTIDVAAGESLPLTVTVYVGGVAKGTATINTTGTGLVWTVSNVALVGNSVNSITAKAKDAAGNESPASVAVSVTSDQTAPNVPTIVSPKDGDRVDKVVNISGTGATDPLSPPVKVKILVDGVEKAEVTAAADGTFAAAGIELAVGKNVITAKAVDAVGNESAPSAAVTVTAVVVKVPKFSVVAVRTTPAASLPKAGYVWKAGQKVQMKVWAEDLVDANAAGFVLKYDPAVVKVVEVIGGKQFGEPIYTDDPVAGILDVSVAVLGEDMKVTGNTTLAAITFEVQTEVVGQTDLVLQTATAFDIYGNEIAATKVNGAIRIIKLLGDFNGDGAVNIADLAILKKYYGKAVGATLPDGTKVPADQVKAGMKVDDPPAGDGKWDIYELRMLATQWGWDWKVLRAPDVGTVDAEGRFLSPAFRDIGLKADRSRVAVGDTVNVELLVDAAGMTAGRVVLKYDPSKLQFVGSVAGEMPFVYVAPGAGTITVDFAPMGGAVGKVASFTFKAIGAGYPGLKVDSSVMWDMTGKEVLGPVAEADLVIGSAELAGKDEKDVGKLELSALYPNPASDYVVVPVSSPKAVAGELVVSTVSGQAVLAKAISLKPGVNQIVVDLKGISSGVYRVMVKADGQVLVRNLVVR